MVFERRGPIGIPEFDWPERDEPIVAHMRPVIAWRVAADGRFRHRPVLAGEWIVALGTLSSRYYDESAYQPAERSYLILSDMDFRRLFDASTTHIVTRKERHAAQEWADPTPLFDGGE